MGTAIKLLNITALVVIMLYSGLTVKYEQEVAAVRQAR